MKRSAIVLASAAGFLLIIALATIGGAQPEQGTSSTTTEGDASAPPESAAGEASVEEGEPAAFESPAETAAPPAGEGLVSVDFKDADIRQVLRIISLKSGVDIVAGNDVEGLVTIKLTNVPWEQALDIILRTYGFTYERKGNIVRVMTVDALESEALATEVFPLDYAKAKEVPDVIKEMLSDRGRVKFDERTNTVIVTDIPTNLFQIKQVVERLDQRTPQVSIESKIVETSLEKDETLGLNWSDGITFTQTLPTITGSFPFRAGSSLGEPGQLFGLDTAPNRGPTDVFSVTTLSSTSLGLVFNFLQSRTDTHIVSNPTIASLNNQEAKIHIGEEYPIPNYTVDPATGRTTITGYTAKNIGTVLTVTPHVNPSNEIVVDLKPEVIAFRGTETFTTGGTSSVSLPRFTTQTAKTQVRIQNGETIVIGGLVKESVTSTEEKIPILGDIPLIGLLFRNKTSYEGSDPNRQDLLIFLTVKLMEERLPPKSVAAEPMNSQPQE